MVNMIYSDQHRSRNPRSARNTNGYTIVSHLQAVISIVIILSTRIFHVQSFSPQQMQRNNNLLLQSQRNDLQFAIPATIQNKPDDLTPRRRELQPARIRTKMPHPNVRPTFESPDASKYEKELIDMIKRFTSHPSDDVVTLPPKYQSLFRGVSAALNDEKPVLRAFVVLYEDITPVRVVGRFIFNYLEDVFSEYVKKRCDGNQALIESTGFSHETIDLGRDVYSLLCSYERRDSLIDELAVSGLFDTDGDPSVKNTDHNEFISTLKNDKHSLETLMVGLKTHSCSEELISKTFASVLSVYGSVERNSKSNVDNKSEKYTARYNNMLKKFAEWEPLFSNVEGQHITRKHEILIGCFVGAKNAAVVEALRIVYTDYTPLRVAGDLIFSLVSKVAGRQKKSILKRNNQ